MNSQELVRNFKTKYPQYRNKSDKEVLAGVFTNYPQYLSAVDYTGPLSENQISALLEMGVHGGIMENFWQRFKLSSNAKTVDARAALARAIMELQRVDSDSQRLEVEKKFYQFEMVCKAAVLQATSQKAIDIGIPLELLGLYLIEEMRAKNGMSLRLEEKRQGLGIEREDKERQADFAINTGRGIKHEALLDRRKAIKEITAYEQDIVDLRNNSRLDDSVKESNIKRCQQEIRRLEAMLG